MTPQPSVPAVANLLRAIPPKQAEEVVENLLRGEGFRLERIISHGHKSPDGFWYEQVEAEWVMVLQGRAILEFENADPPTVELHPGDSLMIPALRRHRVAWTTDEDATVWLALHVKPSAE